MGWDCIPRENHIGTSLNGYIANKNKKIKKEIHRYKSRWISTKMKLTKINDDIYTKRKEQQVARGTDLKIKADGGGTGGKNIKNNNSMKFSKLIL